MTFLRGNNFFLTTLGPFLLLTVVFPSRLSLVVCEDSAVVSSPLDSLESLIGTDGHA